MNKFSNFKIHRRICSHCMNIRCMNISYFEIRHKSCLNNSITPQPIALRTVQTLKRLVFKSSMKKNFLVLGFVFFVVGFWPFWLMLPGLGPNR